MSTKQFHLPDVGEGLTEAEIVTWLVAVGDVVEVNQVIVEIETAKSMVELPSPHAGRVTELLAAAGETVPVGSAIISIETESGADAAPAPAGGDAPAFDESAGDEPKLLVGYGAREEKSGPRRRRAAPASPPAGTPNGTSAEAPKPRAKPPVRKLAKVLGVDLASVTPSGPDCTVVRDDVLDAAGKPKATPPPAVSPRPDDQADSRIPIKGVRKHMASAMVASAFTAPHVTEFVTIDISASMALKDKLSRLRDFKDTKVTVLTIAARAYLLALARTPIANARWDEAAGEIVVPASVNLGIAAATTRGLVVPNIRAAEKLRLHELAGAIYELAATARSGKTPPEAMAGGTTTITNVGVFGVDTGTPILNPGESAILALGAIKRLPWVVEDASGERIEPRSVMTLALSFDHRVMDGQQGSQLLADTAAILSDPGMGLL